MHSPQRPSNFKLLTLATLLSISACATQPPPSPPPSIVRTPSAAPLPANLKAIDPSPSPSLLTASDFLERLDQWSARAAATSPGETRKSKP